ncbi:MAG: class I SAM-dependent methyltransferase [Chitinophagaceae bacterium]|nr:MAG: class I SAM-dependent methyltransferase [Chitinophagaceae bacterium]
MSKRQLDYSRHYSHWHSNDASHVKKMIAFYRNNAVGFFPPDKDAKILDVGCGMGFLLLALKEAGYKNVSGIDSDASQVRACKENGLDVSLIADTFEFLKENAGRYQVISGFDLIEHIPTEFQIDFVENVHTALAEGGHLLLTTPNANSFLASRNRYIDYTHHVLFTETSLDFVLYNGGFKQIEIKPFEYVVFNASPKSWIHRLMFSFFRFFRRLEMMAETGTTVGRKIPLSFNLLAIAKK